MASAQPAISSARLALEPERDEEAAHLGRGRLAAHDLVHDVARLGLREVASVEQPRERFLDRHRLPSRKLRAERVARRA